MKLGGKNKHKSKIRDRHNQTGSALFGGFGGGGVNRKKIRKDKAFGNLRTGDQILMKFDI